MSVTVTKLSGKAFLSFPEMKELLFSELKNRFSIDIHSPQYKDTVEYGDLVYIPDYDGEIPYWCRSCMNEPVLIHFDSTL